MDPTTPFLAPFTGPHGGVPPFDQVDPAHFVPALSRAMELARQQIAAIASATEPPTFENTIVAFETSGREWGRARSLLETYTATMNDKAMQAIEEEMAPVMAAFADEITQNTALFERIRAVHDQRHGMGLTPEQIRLVEVHYKSFARKGAALGQDAKARLAQLNQRLAELFTTFGQQLLADEENDALVLEDPAELAGLPDSLRDSLAAAAEAKGKRGWLVANTRSSVEPFLTYAARRDIRERAWRMWMTRGEHPNPTDNRPIIREILQLRAERAHLLGFPTHAHWILDDTMARTPEAAMALMRKVWVAAVARVREEVADMQKIADGEGAGHAIEAWDYRYYAEKVRLAKYDLDANEVKAYLQLAHMRDAMFWSAKQLFDLDFTRVDDVPVYHPDVTAYLVTRGSEGRDRVGMWYFDPYARDGKRSGAWMSEYRTQERLEPTTPIVSNNSNFVKGRPGEPILISWDDAVTLFHEFGHALHGLLSRVTYPRLAGTSTLTDFVEFPSQLNEHWLATPELLDRFALHFETGQPMPRVLVDKIVKAKNHGSGFRTVEYLMSALYDLEIHLVSGGEVDPLAFERELFAALAAPREIVMRHRPTQFAHIFTGDGYSAGYYSYLWADTLTADAGEAFQEAGSYYDRPTARRYHDEVMSVGNSVPPELAFRAFRGRDVDTNALMRDRGFPVV